MSIFDHMIYFLVGFYVILVLNLEVIQKIAELAILNTAVTSINMVLLGNIFRVVRLLDQI